MRGRRRKEESRAEELRARLTEWKQMPEPSRPSLRQLAREHGASHQLLRHHIKELEKLQIEQKDREAERRIAELEARRRTGWELWKNPEYRAALAAISTPAVLRQIRRDYERGQMSRMQLKQIVFWARSGDAWAVGRLRDELDNRLEKLEIELAKLQEEKKRIEAEITHLVGASANGRESPR